MSFPGGNIHFDRVTFMCACGLDHPLIPWPSSELCLLTLIKSLILGIYHTLITDFANIHTYLADFASSLQKLEGISSLMLLLIYSFNFLFMIYRQIFLQLNTACEISFHFANQSLMSYLVIWTITFFGIIQYILFMLQFLPFFHPVSILYEINYGRTKF